jgi:beta-phosphoglucomutase-like phosphatase (HAD superfamily)
MPTKKIIEAVIFDWDATLANTRRAIVTSFQQTLKSVYINSNISDAYIERRMGIGAAETFREILQEINQPINDFIINELVKKKSQTQIDLKSQVQLFPDTLDFLEILQNKVKIGLASMNSKAVIDALIHAKGVEKYFQII